MSVNQTYLNIAVMLTIEEFNSQFESKQNRPATEKEMEETMNSEEFKKSVSEYYNLIVDSNGLVTFFKSK